MGARSHACPDCGKTFATSSGLKQHRHIHSSVKPFQCEVCLKAYTQFSNLCRHKRMHADCRQQIKCTDCGQAFSTITSLSKHKRFCEGALRNGIPVTFQNDIKTKLPSFRVPPPPSMLNSALLLRMYGGRPTFPILPQFSDSFNPFPFGSSIEALKYLPTPPLPGSFDFMTRHLVDSERSALECERRLYDIEPLRKKVRILQDNSTSDGESDRNQSSDCESVTENNYLKKNAMFENAKIKSNESVSSSNETRLKVPVPIYRTSEFSSHKVSCTRSTSPVNKLSAKTDQPLDLSRSKDTIFEREPISLENRKTINFPRGGIQLSPVDKSTSPVVSPPPHHPITIPKPIKPTVSESDFKSLINPLDSPTYLPYQRYPLTGSHFHLPLVNPYVLRLQQDQPIPSFPAIPGYVDYQCNSVVHKPKDRYSCKFCGKIFPRSANLTRHLRTHTGEQPYKCKYCERSFSISSNLQRHVRNIHNKEKPFRCHICDRCFGQQTNLDRHLKKHETDGPNVIDSPSHDSDDPDDSVFEDGVSGSFENTLSDRDYVEDEDEDDDIDVSEEDEAIISKSDLDMTNYHPSTPEIVANTEHVRERNHSEGILETDSALSQSDENNESDTEDKRVNKGESDPPRTVFTPEYCKLFSHYTGQTQLMCS